VQIRDLLEEKTFSRGNDPHREAAAQQMIMMTAASAAAEVQERALIDVEGNIQAAGRAIAWAREQVRQNPEWAVSHPGPSATQLDLSASSSQGLADAAANPAFSNRTEGAGLTTHGDEDIYDALGISFQVSAPEEIGDAYGVIRVFFRTPEKPDELLTSIRFSGLRNVGPKPQKVFFLHEGITPGFTLENYDIHVYTNGRELATNLSKNRVELTLDEIHQFLILKYGTENSGGGAPVGIAVELFDNDLRALVPDDQKNRGVEVVVNAEGRATKVTLENSGWSSADAYLVQTLMQVRNLPALRNHKPVSDTGRFVLSEFFP